MDEQLIAEEYERRREEYAWLRYASWVTGLVFVVLIIDLFSGRETLSFMKDIDNSIKVYLFIAYLWGNLYIAYDFLTDKLGRWGMVSFTMKIGIVGWNLVCLGHLFGVLQS